MCAPAPSNYHPTHSSPGAWIDAPILHPNSWSIRSKSPVPGGGEKNRMRLQAVYMQYQINCPQVHQTQRPLCFLINDEQRNMGSRGLTSGQHASQLPFRPGRNTQGSRSRACTLITCTSCLGSVHVDYRVSSPALTDIQGGGGKVGRAGQFLSEVGRT